MKIDKIMIFSLIPIIIAFYIIPLFIVDTGTAIIFILVIIPLICFLSTIFYAFNLKSNILYPIISILLYLPTVYIYYSGETFYVKIYALIIFLGYILGKSLNRLKNKRYKIFLYNILIFYIIYTIYN